jgi:predicted ATPase/DNA-binding CsgD family transcriptional regulator
MRKKPVYSPDIPSEPLTRREHDILGQLASNLSNREIAEHLVLAQSSVKWYIKQVYAKLEVNDRQQAIAKATALGWLEMAQPAGQPPNNLSAPPLPLVGRQHDLKKTTHMLADPSCRLLSLVGPGGCGKTRLAQETGAVLLNNFEDGVFFVSLAPLESAESIIPTVACTIGFKFYSSKDDLQQQLLNYLHEKTMLLILDNFEHLLDGVGLVSEILQASHRVKIIATSRARLNVLDEYLYPVAGLKLPDLSTGLNIATTKQDAEAFSAILLFKNCARRILPDFNLHNDDLAFVIRICRAVQGFPLGILLATGWLEMLTPAEIADAIDQDFSFLEADLFDLPERQRSMRAVFNQSWKILSEHERAMFSACSVFRSGFTAKAAHAVAGATLHDLMCLVNKSLLQRDQNGRYHLHELLKQFSAEKLAANTDRQQAVEGRHCAYFAGYLHKRETDLHGKDQWKALAEIETEIEEIRVGWEWAVENGRIEWLADYLESMGELYDSRGWLREGSRLFALAEQKLFEMKEDDRAVQLLRGRLMMWLGILCVDIETEENLKQLFLASATSFRALGAQRELAAALSYFGLLDYLSSESGSEAFAQESLSIFKELGDRHGVTLALSALANAALGQEDYALAKQRYQNSLVVLKELGDTKEIIRCLNGMGYTCWRLGEYQEAKQCHEESLALCKATGDQYGMAVALAHLGKDIYGLKDYQKTRELFTSSLELYKEMGARWGVASQFADLGELMLTMKEYSQAAQYAQESIDTFSMVTHEANSWNLRVIGNAALGMGDLKKTQSYLCMSLNHAAKICNWGYSLLTMVGIARLLIKLGEKEELVLELLALVMSHSKSWQMGKDQAAPLIAELQAQLPPEVAAAAQERGKSRDLDRTIRELLVELSC